MTEITSTGITITPDSWRVFLHNERMTLFFSTWCYTLRFAVDSIIHWRRISWNSVLIFAGTEAYLHLRVNCTILWTPSFPITFLGNVLILNYSYLLKGVWFDSSVKEKILLWANSLTSYLRLRPFHPQSGTIWIIRTIPLNVDIYWRILWKVV